MRLSLLTLFLGSVLPLWSMSATAQIAGQQFDTRRTGSCPSKEDWKRIHGSTTETGPAEGMGATYVLRPNPTAYQSDVPASPPADFQVKVFSLVGILGYSDRTKRVLVSTLGPAARTCAWVARADLLIDNGVDASKSASLQTAAMPMPMPGTQAPSRPSEPNPLADFKEGPRALVVRQIDTRDPNNVLIVKAVLTNLNVSGNEDIPTYTVPEDSKTFTRLSLFEHYTVYAQRFVEKANPGQRPGTYYLLGTTAMSSETLIGWVYVDDIFLWNSRMAVFWKGTKKGEGWVADDLKGDPVMKEPDAQEPKSHSLARYPVLRVLPRPEEVQQGMKRMDPDQRTPLALSKLVHKFQAAIPGDACRKDKAGDKDCLSSGDFDKLRQEYFNKIQSLKLIDVMFLIDGTASMDEYFPATAAAIRKFVAENVKKLQDKGVSLRVGAWVYGDYEGLEALPERVYYKPLVEFYDVGLADVRPLDALAKHRPEKNKDEHLDKLEAPFAAIVQATGEKGWRPEAMFHYLVHVADHGNRELNKASGEGNSRLVERIGHDTVVKALESQRLTYLPISVLGSPNEKTQAEADARRAFFDQGARLLNARRQTKSKVIQAYERVGAPERPEQREAVVLQALRDAFENSALGNTITAGWEVCQRERTGAGCEQVLNQPTATTAAQDYRTEIVTERLREGGLTPAESDNIMSRTQSVLKVWVPPVTKVGANEVETLSYYIAMDQAQLRRLQGAFVGLCQAVVPGAPAQTSSKIVKAVQDTINIGAGEEVEPSRTLAAALSLPFWERTRRLSMDIQSITAKVTRGDPAEVIEIKKDFCRSAYLLHLVMYNYRMDPAKVSFEATGMIKEADRSAMSPYTWAVTSGRDTDWYYIPIEYLP